MIDLFRFILLKKRKHVFYCEDFIFKLIIVFFNLFEHLYFSVIIYLK